MSWSLNLGFLELDSSGITAKPKFDFGANIDGHGFNAGIGDLRDGIKIGASAGSSQKATAEGSTIEEFVRRLKFEGQIARALDINKIVRLITRALADVTRMTGIDGLVGGHVKIKGTCDATLGVGVGGEVALGWEDHDGYNMIGGGGKVLAGATVMAGTDKYDNVKLIIGAAYGPFFRFEIEVMKL